MLVCISANPAIDRRLRLESIAVGEVNRALSAQPFPGGKAAHVAMVAKALGVDVMWVGFLGGAAGEECESGLSAYGVPLTVIRTQTETRANLELVSADGVVTEILEPGGAVTEGEVERLLATCRDIFAESDRGTQVALSGSLPPGSPSDLYAQLIRLAHLHGCRALLDTSGEALREGLRAAPDFVKPNRNEASSFAGYAIHDTNAALEATQQFFDAGAKSVAISLGAEGMIWQRNVEADPFISRPSVLRDCSSVGCGDAALAGFAVAYERGLSDEETLRLATACGSANCLAKAPGRVDQRDVLNFAREISVQRLVNDESARRVSVEAK
ncbi:MAG TPA: 1-phosphofructokinase family hexose kinase [Pyrinomonadaceae bacterium]|nr:1-phosphofructokinase family hexose kinase [Pyrinomonadaceae bacterium]